MMTTRRMRSEPSWRTCVHECACLKSASLNLLGVTLNSMPNESMYVR